MNDTVVNQLLSKIDGVDQLNNILVIGMTNRCKHATLFDTSPSISKDKRAAIMTNRRRDMMDDALLRPGRLEVQIEIGLPKEKGRTQILHIHTKKVLDDELCFD